MLKGDMMQNQGLVACQIVSSLEKVFPNIEPSSGATSNIIAKNENLNFQIALKNLSMAVLENIQIRIHGALAEHISIRMVDFVPVTYVMAEEQIDDYYLCNEPSLMPDILKPIGPLGIVLPRAQWRSFWISIEAKDGLPVGEFETVFEVTDESNEKLADVRYQLEILDLELPQSDLIVTNWMHYDCIAEKHNVSLFSDEFYNVFDKYLKAYIDAGNTMLLIPLFTPPLDTQVGGERQTVQLVKVRYINNAYAFDFSELKKFIDFIAARGIRYFELSHLFTQWGGEHCPKVIAETENGEVRIFGWETDSHSAEYAQFLKELLPNLVDVLKEKGIIERCFLHLTDEPSEAHLESYKKCREMVKPYIENIPILDALSEYNFYELGLIDLPVPITTAYDEFYSKHNVTDNLVYYCCIPTSGYYSNRFINMPSLRTRILGLQLYNSGVKGFLHWGFNFYHTKLSIEEIDPYCNNDGGGFFPSGDGFVVYPTNDGVLYSIRLELLRECFQDYRLLKALEKQIGREQVLKMLQEWGLSGFNVYPHLADEFSSFRKRIYKILKGGY